MSMEVAYSQPLDTPKPLTQTSPRLACVIKSWVEPGMKNLTAIGIAISATQIRDFAVPFDVSSFYVQFLGSTITLES